MAFLNESQVQIIKEHMIAGDAAMLNSKFKSKNTPYDLRTIDLNEVEDYEKDGWEVVTTLKRKVKIQREKETGRKFEDDVWCLFFKLGFKTLNYDEHLEIQWGSGAGDHHQLDVVAVDDEAIFVVECKAADKPRNANFKKDIDNLCQYKEGVTKALRQIYGEKKVKFVFATRNYKFSESSEDLQRLKNNKIYHFNENSYNYINNLIKAYKTSVKYQFYGLMFKNELISNDKIKIPALKGSMGGHDYYMLSIEPSILLKIGFVLHRTKVNDSMAPTYQRLLVPSRLKGITKFIDDGGYFPNSIIVNFDSPNKKLKIQFEPSSNVGDTNSRFGTLTIPNAYGIAFIIDGQHRVYGYAGSKYKDTNTIPVVAFDNIDSQEQLKIFMDINENQKSVNPSLRLDLAEDINWDSERADSRMLALRSSIIKVLTRDSNSVLYTKISVGEDSAKLTLKPFITALSKSSLLPKATNRSYTQDTDVCLYDCNNLDHNKAMNDAKKRISNLLLDSYAYMYEKLDEDIFKNFFEDNRGTYAFIVVIGSLNRYLINSGQLTPKSTTTQQIQAMSPYFDALVNYFTNLPAEHRNTLFVVKGQGADTTWLHMFENAINEKFQAYQPEGLKEWKESQDDNLQQEGRNCGKQIEQILHNKVLDKLQDLHGDKWERTVFEIKAKCLQRMSSDSPDDTDINENNWPDYLQVSDYKDIIEKNWILTKEDDEKYVTFENDFSIRLSADAPFKSRKDKLKWLNDLILYRNSWTSTKPKPLTRGQVDELYLILSNLQPTE
jgi:DNA sulfur modification protein DndB